MTLRAELAKEAPEGVALVEAVSTEALAEHPLRTTLEASGFAAKVGEHRPVPTADGVGFVVGTGPDTTRTLDDVRKVGAAIARAARKQDAVATDVLGTLGELEGPAAAQALAEGVALGGYTYLALKSSPTPPALAAVHVLGRGGKRVQDALDLGLAVGAAANVTRDLVNEPGGSLTAPAFAKRIAALGKAHGFEVTVLDEKAIKAAGMGGLLGVNRGSEQPPRFVELRWVPEGKPRGVVALVGKGITFDSGGLSIKPSDGMLTMKCDMAGAGAVVGAFCGLAAVQPKVEVRGYLPLTDNMTGGDATRLGDVLRYANGKTVEIHNTDAEGRLVLADALIRASDGKPDAIVDLATLTGACMVALGDDRAGLFGFHQGFLDQVSAAAGTAGELVWQLPLPKEWRPKLDSDVADMKNIGDRYGGASTAALFLAEFVGEGIPWAHLDIAGPAFASAEGTLHPKGGTGFAVRTLLALLKGFTKPR